VPLSERKAETRSTSDRYQGGLQATERDLGHMGEGSSGKPGCGTLHVLFMRKIQWGRF
jgi:hypothetical protein